MELQSVPNISAHEQMKRMRDARRVAKLFTEACDAFGVQLETKKASLNYVADYIYFVEPKTCISLCMEMSTYKVKAGTNYTLSLFVPDAPDGRWGPGEADRKRGPLALCIQYLAVLVRARIDLANRCYLERVAAHEKLRAAGGRENGPIYYLFGACSATVESTGRIHVEIPFSLTADEALPFLLEGLKRKA